MRALKAAPSAGLGLMSYAAGSWPRLCPSLAGAAPSPPGAPVWPGCASALASVRTSNPRGFYPPKAHPHGDLQSPAPARRRHRPRGDGRGEEAHRLDERARHGHVQLRRRPGRRRLLRRARRLGHRRDGRQGEGGRRGDLRRGRRAEMGQGALRRAPRGRPAAAAQGPRRCSATCARRSAIRRSPTHRASSATWSTGSTS